MGGTPPTQHLTQMAPFPSIGKTFPADPTPKTIRTTYQELRAAAITVNRSRSQYMSMLRKRDDQQKVIIELQNELASFAADAQMALEEKARLNVIVDKYADIIGQLETAGDELVESISEYDRGAVTIQGFRPIRRLLSSCRAFMAAWRSAKELAANIEDTNNGLLS